ncbi:MAG: rhomboid family intramembrane serine protease [Alphaproteobacteria bacterium]|nr:rhomboid family intramembrane serine protease [Alphaproteobacteria bacterium]
MADPLSPDGAPPRDRPVDDRDARLQRLQRATSGPLLFEGMRRPWLTIALVVVLVAVHVALGLRMWSNDRVDLLGSLVVARPDRLLVRAGGQFGPGIGRGEAWRLVSAVFLHGSGLHLLLNATALLGLGRLVESLYGRGRYLFLFVACGVGGALLSYLGGTRLSIGASGAIFGLMGAPIVFGWRHRAQLPEGLGDDLRRALLPWVVLNLAIGFIVPFIDNLAHVGGLVTGCLLALVLGNRVVPGLEGRRWVPAVLAALAVAAVAWAAVGVAGEWL